jgi:hypothetical protein
MAKRDRGKAGLDLFDIIESDLDPADKLRGAIHHFIDVEVDLWTNPQYVTSWSAGMLVAAVCKKAGLPLVAALIISCAAALCAHELYDVVKDIHETALAQREYLELCMDKPVKGLDAAGTD